MSSAKKMAKAYFFRLRLSYMGSPCSRLFIKNKILPHGLNGIMKAHCLLSPTQHLFANLVQVFFLNALEYIRMRFHKPPNNNPVSVTPVRPLS